MGYITFSIVDYSKETSRVGFHIPDLNGLNADNYTTDLLGSALGDMRLALNPLILGNHVGRIVTAKSIKELPITYPDDENAQVERKAAVTYQDVVNGSLYTLEIPTFSMVGVLPNSDEIDLAQEDWANFVSEFEANFVSRAGNAVSVLRAMHVGRKR